MKKRTAALLLILILCLTALTAAGCKDKDDGAGTPAAEAAEQTPIQSVQTPEPVQAEKPASESSGVLLQDDGPVDDSGVPDETALFAAMEAQQVS